MNLTLTGTEEASISQESCVKNNSEVAFAYSQEYSDSLEMYDMAKWNNTAEAYFTLLKHL